MVLCVRVGTSLCVYVSGFRAVVNKGGCLVDVGSRRKQVVVTVGDGLYVFVLLN